MRLCQKEDSLANRPPTTDHRGRFSSRVVAVGHGCLLRVLLEGQTGAGKVDYDIHDREGRSQSGRSVDRFIWIIEYCSRQENSTQ